MKTEKNILVAFILNVGFSIIEFIGGILTNSVAIYSDAIHDLGDAFSIGVSFFLEKKSKKNPDKNYTYGYVRYSVLGGVITTTILLVGSILVIIGAVKRIFNPVDVNYDGMLIFAILGVVLNFIAALRHDPSLYRFIDAVVVRAAVGVGTGAQLKAVGFAPEDAKISVVPFLRFPATVSYCRNERGFTVRVPLAENTFLYILTPLKGKSLASLEASVKGENIREIIAGVESVTEKDCGSVDGVVELPAMDFTSIVDTDAAFTVAKIPTSGFVHIDSSLAKRESFQYTRFILEGAPAEPAEDGKSAKKWQTNDKGQRKFVFNRPFLFFIYNREADLIPVIGRFTGK